MKLYKFSEKLPLLGSNIVIIHETGKAIAIVEFDLDVRKSVLETTDSGDYFEVDYYTDDANENRGYDVRCADYWFYPSSIKLPKSKNANS